MSTSTGGYFPIKITVVFPFSKENKCLGQFSQELPAVKNFKSAVSTYTWGNKVDYFVYFKVEALG